MVMQERLGPRYREQHAKPLYRMGDIYAARGQKPNPREGRKIRQFGIEIGVATEVKYPTFSPEAFDYVLDRWGPVNEKLSAAAKRGYAQRVKEAVRTNFQEASLQASQEWIGEYVVANPRFFYAIKDAMVARGTPRIPNTDERKTINTILAKNGIRVKKGIKVVFPENVLVEILTTLGQLNMERSRAIKTPAKKKEPKTRRHMWTNWENMIPMPKWVSEALGDEAPLFFNGQEVVSGLRGSELKIMRILTRTSRRRQVLRSTLIQAIREGGDKEMGLVIGKLSSAMTRLKAPLIQDGLVIINGVSRSDRMKGEEAKYYLNMFGSSNTEELEEQPIIIFEAAADIRPEDLTSSGLRDINHRKHMENKRPLRSGNHGGFGDIFLGPSPVYSNNPPEQRQINAEPFLKIDSLGRVFPIPKTGHERIDPDDIGWRQGVSATAMVSVMPDESGFVYGGKVDNAIPDVYEDLLDGKTGKSLIAAIAGKRAMIKAACSIVASKMRGVNVNAELPSNIALMVTALRSQKMWASVPDEAFPLLFADVLGGMSFEKFSDKVASFRDDISLERVIYEAPVLDTQKVRKLPQGMLEIPREGLQEEIVQVKREEAMPPVVPEKFQELWKIPEFRMEELRKYDYQRMGKWLDDIKTSEGKIIRGRDHSLYYPTLIVMAANAVSQGKLDEFDPNKFTYKDLRIALEGYCAVFSREEFGRWNGYELLESVKNILCYTDAL